MRSTTKARACDIGYVNATELCKSFGRHFKQYRQLKSSKVFLDELAIRTGVPVEELVVIKVGSSRKDAGTRVHPDVAVHLERWCFKTLPWTKRHTIKPGDKFHRLTAVAFHHDRGYPELRIKRPCFTFRCDCGTEKIILCSSVVSGNTKSCGCLNREHQTSWNKEQRLPDNIAAIHQIYSSYRKGAHKRGYAFDISVEEFGRLVEAPCSYCGDTKSNTVRNRYRFEPFSYNGVDRADNKKGYVAGNVLTCCRTCNKMKGTQPLSDFLARIQRAATQIKNNPELMKAIKNGG